MDEGAQGFANLREVVAYLKANGWKVSQTTVYEHGRQGKVRPGDDGLYTLRAVEKYARTYLPTVETKQQTELDGLQRAKLIAEVAMKTEHAKAAKARRMYDEGRYILREDVYLELAARAAVLETTLRNWIKVGVEEWVAAVKGDMALAEDLTWRMIEQIDAAMNEFASVKKFEVLFKASGEKKVEG